MVRRSGTIAKPGMSPSLDCLCTRPKHACTRCWLNGAKRKSKKSKPRMFVRSAQRGKCGQMEGAPGVYIWKRLQHLASQRDLANPGEPLSGSSPSCRRRVWCAINVTGHVCVAGNVLGQKGWPLTNATVKVRHVLFLLGWSPQQLYTSTQELILKENKRVT